MNAAMSGVQVPTAMPKALSPVPRMGKGKHKGHVAGKEHLGMSSIGTAKGGIGGKGMTMIRGGK